eukprot:COSAG02_NODE_3736_length_6305_cov_9.603609_3_plen_667_part_00
MLRESRRSSRFELGASPRPRRFADVVHDDSVGRRVFRGGRPSLSGTRVSLRERVSTEDALAEVLAMRAEGQAERRRALEKDGGIAASAWAGVDALQRTHVLLHEATTPVSAAKDTELGHAKASLARSTSLPHANDSHSGDLTDDSTSTDGSADGIGSDCNHSGTNGSDPADQTTLLAHQIHSRLTAAQQKVNIAEQRKRAAIEARQQQKRADDPCRLEHLCQRSATVTGKIPPELPTRAIDAGATSAPQSPPSEQASPEKAEPTVWGFSKWTLEPEGESELATQVGDCVEVLDSDVEEWWYCRHRGSGAEGWVPSECVLVYAATSETLDEHETQNATDADQYKGKESHHDGKDTENTNEGGAGEQEGTQECTADADTKLLTTAVTDESSMVQLSNTETRELPAERQLLVNMFAEAREERQRERHRKETTFGRSTNSDSRNSSYTGRALAVDCGVAKPSDSSATRLSSRETVISAEKRKRAAVEARQRQKRADDLAVEARILEMYRVKQAKREFILRQTDQKHVKVNAPNDFSAVDTEMSELMDLAEHEGLVTQVCDAQLLDTEEVFAPVAVMQPNQAVHKPKPLHLTAKAGQQTGLNEAPTKLEQRLEENSEPEPELETTTETEPATTPDQTKGKKKRKKKKKQKKKQAAAPAGWAALLAHAAAGQ